mgnify:CR=1 FL=1
MTVTVLPYYPPRKSERTFPMIRASVGNMGRKQITLKNVGIRARGKK